MEGRQVLGGRYRLLNELGSGGTAVVWRARDEVLDRPVAVKLLAVRYAGDPHSRARIRDEARAAANLLHPNIAQVYDFGEATDGAVPLPYVVMELVDGPTLQERIMSGPLPPRTIFRICGEVAAALAYAHDVGLVHRDIKLANIMVTRGGAKVVDFGIAAAIGLASENMLLGTPAYLAPERLTGDAVVPASDVYALGVLLYRLLAGFTPWSVESTTQMLEAHVYLEPAPLPALPGVPPAVAALIGRCLRKDPESRPTASQVSSALADAAEASPEDVRREAARRQTLPIPAASGGMAAPARGGAPEMTTATWAFAPRRAAGPVPPVPPAPPARVPPAPPARVPAAPPARVPAAPPARMPPAPPARVPAAPPARMPAAPPARVPAAPPARMPAAPPARVPHPRAAGEQRTGAPVGSAAATGPARSGGAQPSAAGGGGAPRVRHRARRLLLAGGGLAALITAVLAAWFLGGEAGEVPAAGGVTVAPTVPSSFSAVTGQPILPVTAGSDSSAPTAPVKTSRPTAQSSPSPKRTRPASPVTSAPTVFDPPPLEPPPVGTRLTVTGGVVYATCSTDSATLTGWEPASGFTVASVQSGPAPATTIIFASSDAMYQATVSCVADVPKSIVVQV